LQGQQGFLKPMKIYFLHTKEVSDMSTIKYYLHKLLLVVSIVFLLGGIGTFGSMSNNGYGMSIPAKILAAVFGIILFLLGGGGLFLFYALPKRCIHCKKWFAMQKRATTLIQIKGIYTTVENRTRSAYSGEVISTTEQHIPGKRKTYRTTYVCQYCGAEEYEDRNVDTPNT
jgi:hypothetical protein